MYVIARALHVVAAASALIASGCGAPEDPPTTEATQALGQAGHTGGAVRVFDAPPFHRVGSVFSDLYWYMTPRDAALWVNDPDCPGNNCGATPAGAIPTGEVFSSLAGLPGDASALCWAMRNPDHFVTNPLLASATFPVVGHAPTWSELREPTARNAAMAGWIARSADQALTALGDAGQYAAYEQTTRVGSIGLARARLRAAFNACHFAMDKLACGHKTGNAWCDPTANAPTQSCVQFVHTNRLRLPTVERTIATAMIGEIAASACRGPLDPGYPVALTRGIQFAAAERYIRHHTSQPMTEGSWMSMVERVVEGTTVWLPEWGPWGAIGQTSTNGCTPGCENGECVGGQTAESVGADPEVGQACVDQVASARDQLERNASFFTSPLYKYDPAHACRAVSNYETCTTLGGYCRGGGGSAMCMKRIPSADGVVATTGIGTCDEGKPFGGALAPSCQYDERSTTPPVTPACAARCRAVKGFLEASGKCTATFSSPWAGETLDVTAAVCGDLAGTGSQGVCDALTPMQRCYAVGGQCANDFSQRCARSYDLVPTYPGSPTMMTSWSDDTAIGTCAQGGSFNTAYPPNCQQPVVWSSINFPNCTGDYTACGSDADCCAGSCRDTFTHQPFLSTSAMYGTYGECTPAYSSGYAWIDYASVGTGSGGVALSTGGSCGAGCSKPVPASTSVTLTATPAPGSRLTGWTGCDAASGTQCTVTSASVRTVTARFDVGAPQAPGRAPIGFIDVIGTQPTSRADGTVEGWAYDPDSSASSITVRLLIDNVVAATALADRPRPDVNAVMNVTGNHGFLMSIPSWYRNLQRHHVEVVAVDDGAGAPAASSPTLWPSSPTISKDFTMGYCKIESPSACSPWPWMVFPWYDSYDGASYGQARCAQRAPEYFSWCAMTGGWVTATLVPAP